MIDPQELVEAILRDVERELGEYEAAIEAYRSYVNNYRARQQAAE